MRRCVLLLWLMICTQISWGQSWCNIHNVSHHDAVINFPNPPQEFASHVIWGWEGPMDLSVIEHDLDSIKAKGFRSVIFEAGYGLPYEYLSEDWFLGIKKGVLEAKKRGLKVWLIDEGKYPSGFAGGKFTRERPDLRMKAIVSVDTIRVLRNTSLKGVLVNPKAISAVAVSEGQPNHIVTIKNGRINFNAGEHDWQIILAGTDFRTGQTRAVNNPKRGKDTNNSICDYLDPMAVRLFIDWTHEQYKKYLGEEFGKTVLGFRGDEPDFAYTPWTPKMATEFKSRKGYDPTPYYASLILRSATTEEENQFRADYWDVWSQLFSQHFFKQQADWCAANGLAHITHLNNDHNMPVCVRAEGSFFRDLKEVQIPGVDAIWNQIWPETINDFPKFASSVSHVYGKPRAFSESFAAYNTPPTIPTAKYAVDYQMTRGINFFEFMFWMAGSKQPNWMSDPGMKALNEYTNRVTYLLSLGKPGARIAVYYPTSTLWLKDNSFNTDLLTIAQLLLHHQRDFDWVDEDAFSEALTVGPGYLENRSGQRYSTLIIPSCKVITAAMWRVIEEYTRRGGQVLFWGKKPEQMVDQSFLKPQPLPTLKRSYKEETHIAWTPIVESALPRPELLVDHGKDSTALTYAHRVLKDADLYFVFNEGETPMSVDLKFDQSGTLRQWNGYTGDILEINARAEDSYTLLHVTLAPWESRLFSIEKRAQIYNAKSLGLKGDGSLETRALQSAIDYIAQAGGGTLSLPEGRYLSGALFFPKGVNLHMAANAYLQASTNMEEYPLVPTRFEGKEIPWRSAFLNFNDAEGVTVSGEGTIDGNGVAWKQHPFAQGGRPRLILFNHCDGGSIKGLKLCNQASWCLHILYTHGLTVDGVDISVPEYVPSSDGIDIDSSSDVIVLKSSINVHDDCISIKSGKDEEGRRLGRPSEHILIEYCHFGYGHGAIAIGSEISGDVRHVLVRKCTVDAGNWSPFRFKSQPSRGGHIDDICFEDVNFEGVKNVFDINMDWRSGSQRDSVFVYADELTSLSNIRFVRCSGVAEGMGSINGYRQTPISREAIRFEDCHFIARRKLKLTNAQISSKGINIKIIKE